MAQSSHLGTHDPHAHTRSSMRKARSVARGHSPTARKTPTTLHTPYKGRAGGRSEHDVPLSLALSRRLTSTSATPEPAVRDPPRTIPPGPPPVTTSQRFGRQVGSNVGGTVVAQSSLLAHTTHTRTRGAPCGKPNRRDAAHLDAPNPEDTRRRSSTRGRDRGRRARGPAPSASSPASAAEMVGTVERATAPAGPARTTRPSCWHRRQSLQPPPAAQPRQRARPAPKERPPPTPPPAPAPPQPLLHR